MADRNVDVKFRFLNDRAATTQLLRDQDRVEQGYDDMAKAAARTTDAGRKALDAQIKVARESASIYGDVASRTSSISGLASALGGTAAGGRLMIASDILDATEAAKSLRAELPKMASELVTAAGGVGNLALAGGAAALAVAGLYAAVQILGKSTEEAEAKTRAHIAALEYINTLTPGTTQQLKEERDQLQGNIDQRQKLIDQLENERAELLKSLNPWEQLGEATGVVGYGVNEYDDKLKELNQTQEEAKNKVVELTNALDNFGGGMADWDQAGRDALTQLDKNAQYEIDLRRKVATYTTEQVDQEMAALEREKTAKENELGKLNTMLANYTITQEQYNQKTAELKGEIEGLSMDMADLNTLVRDAAEAREREARALEAAKNHLEALNKRLEDSIQKELDRGKAITQGAAILAKAEYDREQATVESEKAIAESEAKYRDDRAGATRDFEQQRLDIESKSAEARTALIQEHQDTIAGIEEKYRDDKAKAEADFRRDQKRREEDHRDTLLEAAANLDAPAVLAEQRRFSKEQRRAEEDFKDGQRQRDKEYRQQLRDENDAFKKRQDQAKTNDRKELQRLQQQYNSRISQMDSAHRAELTRIQRANADKLQAITTAANNEIKQLFGFNTDEYTVRAQHYKDLLTQLSIWSSQARAMVTTGSSVGGTGGRVITTGPGSPRYAIPEYDDGGYTTGGIIGTRPREFMLDRQTTRALERGFGGALTQRGIQRLVTNNNRTMASVTINVSGAGDPEAVGRVVLQKFGEVLGI